MGRLDDKVAIITGSATGIGRAGAILFAKEGARVVVADWSAEGGEETADLIKKTGGESVFVRTDVSKTEDVRKMVKVAVNTYNKLDILYNNAGIAPLEGSTVDTTEEFFEKIIAINLKGTWLSMKYAIPEMEKIGGGTIVNTGSLGGDRGITSIPIYSASKGGVLALSRATAMEYSKKNIRVNCINPGAIATPMLTGSWTPEIFQRFTDILVPEGRLGEPEDVAKTALFLASEESAFITGQTIPVDGGWSVATHL
jgi:NAD(P)-dependent dehydrogenase (short-subunit alcohol dehydrogenase family)